jgi:hypothetical protein
MRSCVAAFIMLSLCLAAPPANSHGGGLNADGCHNETATGSYHCHNSKSGSRSSLSKLAISLISIGAIVLATGATLLWNCVTHKRGEQEQVDIESTHHLGDPQSLVQVRAGGAGIVVEF